jgi:hypothetical protein
MHGSLPTDSYVSRKEAEDNASGVNNKEAVIMKADFSDFNICQIKSNAKDVFADSLLDLSNDIST